VTSALYKLDLQHASKNVEFGSKNDESWFQIKKESHLSGHVLHIRERERKGGGGGGGLWGGGVWGVAVGGRVVFVIYYALCKM
jgi:hypothetical protein